MRGGLWHPSCSSVGRCRRLLRQIIILVRFLSPKGFPMFTHHPLRIASRRLLALWAMALIIFSGVAAEGATQPDITSPTSASAMIGASFSYQITATEDPDNYSASGLPAGITCNTFTGLISGTPLSAGTSTVTIGATNALGTGSDILILTVTDSGVVTGPPVITSATSVTGAVGLAFGFQIEATQTPTHFSATGLPTGLALNATTGEISGTPLIAGTSVVAVAATNSMGSDYATLGIAIVESAPPGAVPQITSALSRSGNVGVEFSYAINATNIPTSFSALGLPGGLAIDVTTGLISGTPTTAATTDVTIGASNAQGSDSETLRLVISTSGGGTPPTENSSTENSSSCGAGSGVAILAAMLLAIWQVGLLAPRSRDSST